jgi:hypothetical protein
MKLTIFTALFNTPTRLEGIPFDAKGMCRMK